MTILICLLAADEVGELIRDLGSEEYQTRERSTAALIEKGEAVVERLRAVETRDPEVQWRVRHIVAEIDATKHAELLVSVVSVADRAWEVRHYTPREGAIDIGPVRWTVKDGGLWRNFERLVEERIVSLGTHGGRESFVLARRNVRFREGELGVWRPVVAAELERPPSTDVPAVFHLLARAPAFPETRSALEKLERESPDPLVRSLCARAREGQR